MLFAEQAERAGDDRDLAARSKLLRSMPPFIASS
jgi:hypothetical protein